jgi:predicted nucleic acid-binding protein
VAALTPAFLDTSILLAGLIELGPASEHPQRLMAAIAEGRVRDIHTAWHCCLEFYSVSTRLPEELRLDPEDAHRLLAEEVLARLRIHQLPDDARASFLAATAADRVVGGRIYDAHIGEVARHAGARAVVTDNRRHFASLARHGIRVMDAREFLA